MDLLKNALETVYGLASMYLENIDHRGDGWLTLTSLVGHNGALNQNASDKIVMCVYNITRETTVNTYQRNMAASQNERPSDAYAIVNPPLFLDVHLMFMANFAESKYGDGLAVLSRLISFFQQAPYFNRDNAPQLAPEIDKLTLEFENLNPVDVNYVMGMLGTRYLPSAFYKLRMIPFKGTAMTGRSYPVVGAGTSGGSTAAGNS